jgi:hypothetical protein
MDPIGAGGLNQVHQNLFDQAEQTLAKSNQGVSDFEKLREKMEQQENVGGSQQLDQIQKLDQMQQVNQAGQVDPTGKVQNVPDLKGAEVPKVTNMNELQSMVNDIRGGQGRLNQLLSDATSGKTYSPSEMIAMQAEVGKITTQLDLATKVVENFVSSVKTTLNIQF